MTTTPPLGAILAGGRGRRLGGPKATVLLAGRPMLEYPLRAMRGALPEVVVVAKPGTPLPALGGIDVLREPATPVHPLVGIREALRRAAPRAVVVCAVDLVAVSIELIARLATADARSRPVVAARGPAGWQPLLARYEPEALGAMPSCPDGRRMLDVLDALGPVALDVTGPELLNVNRPEDLEGAIRR